ncbi:hypothetical protein G7046_g5249 [Stylonectria norvegica]|nr:hypothetical protein G7046_g5249 [Stylonectria norvegica]
MLYPFALLFWSLALAEPASGEDSTETTPLVDILSTHTPFGGNWTWPRPSSKHCLSPLITFPTSTLHLVSETDSATEASTLTTSSTQEVPTITSTLTDLPVGFLPTTVTGHTEWTRNTWVTTTSPGTTTPTVVPVLVGCKGCGGRGSGIVIFGVPPVPNTVFSFPKFPSIPKVSFSCIPIPFADNCKSSPRSEEGQDDDQKPTSEPQSSSHSLSTTAASSCTEDITASDCIVACTSYTNLDASETTADCDTSCYNTQTGCSVTGVTSTTAAEACSATGGGGTCAQCVAGSYYGSSDAADDTVDERSIAGRVVFRSSGAGKGINYLERRKKKTTAYSKIGLQGYCKLKAPIKPPIYISGIDLFARDKAGTLSLQQQTISRWWIKDQHCLSISRVEYAEYHQGSEGGKLNTPQQATTDHAYEKKWFTDFFESILSENAPPLEDATGVQLQINCDDLNLFTYNRYQEGSVKNRLQPILSLIPNQTHFLDDLIGMDEYTNSLAKGLFTGPIDIRSSAKYYSNQDEEIRSGMGWDTAQRMIRNKLGFLERLVIGASACSQQAIVDAMKRTNRRIWLGYKNMDKDLQCKDAISSGKWSFADRYQSYMNNRFSGTTVQSINAVSLAASVNVLPSLLRDINTVDAMLTDQSPDSQRNYVKDFRKKYDYLKTEAVYVAAPFLWDWTELSTRQDGDTELGGSCELPSTSEYSGSSSTADSSSSETEFSSTELPSTSESDFPTTTGFSSGTETSTGTGGTAETGTSSEIEVSGSATTSYVEASSTFTGSDTTAFSSSDTAEATTSSSSPLTTSMSPYCYYYASPDEGVEYCECNDGKEYSVDSGADDLCPLTSPGPSGMEIFHTTATAASFPQTITNAIGQIEVCTGFSELGGGIPGSACLDAPTSTSESPSETTVPGSTCKIDEPGSCTWLTCSAGEESQCVVTSGAASNLIAVCQCETEA